MEALLKPDEQAKNIDFPNLPQNLDVTAESITANVHAMNAACQPPQHFPLNLDVEWCYLGQDDRIRFIFKSLVSHSQKQNWRTN